VGRDSLDWLRGQVETADVGVRSLTHEATRFGKEGVQIFGSERHCAERSKDPLVIKQALRSGLVLSSSHA
jgi:hypothetical protein